MLNNPTVHADANTARPKSPLFAVSKSYLSEHSKTRSRLLSSGADAREARKAVKNAMTRKWIPKKSEFVIRIACIVKNAKFHATKKRMSTCGLNAIQEVRNMSSFAFRPKVFSSGTNGLIDDWCCNASQFGHVSTPFPMAIPHLQHGFILYSFAQRFESLSL
jgi:hypothetical protein